MPENSEELKRKSDEEFLRHLPSMSEVSRAIRTGDDPSPEEALGRIKDKLEGQQEGSPIHETWLDILRDYELIYSIELNKRCKLFEERLKQQNKRSIICSNERARDNYLHSINENITNDEKSLIDLRKSIKEQIDPRRDSGYGDYRELLKLLSYKYIVKDSERMLKENPMVAVFGIFSTGEGNYSGLLACKLAAIDNLRAEAKPPAQKDNKEHAT